MEIKVVKDILGANEQLAQKNRDLLDSRHIFTINLMSSPGAGKTSLITATIRRLKGMVKVGVIEGDIASSYDAEQVAKEDVPVIQINTGGGCHLDANLVQNALINLPLSEIELLIIENVGNLICPAEFALGEHKKVVLTSTPEGSDKPLKYPMMFRQADAIIINKVDLLPYVRFDTEAFTRTVYDLNRQAPVFQVSYITGQGLDEWVSWLQAQMTRNRRKT
jgi:hydrogenase nickel incorporation protein HypB